MYVKEGWSDLFAAEAYNANFLSLDYAEKKGSDSFIGKFWARHASNIFPQTSACPTNKISKLGGIFQC